MKYWEGGWDWFDQRHIGREASPVVNSETVLEFNLIRKNLRSIDLEVSQKPKNQ
jgi:hypothetical protein